MSVNYRCQFDNHNHPHYHSQQRFKSIVVKRIVGSEGNCVVTLDVLRFPCSDMVILSETNIRLSSWRTDESEDERNKIKRSLTFREK